MSSVIPGFEYDIFISYRHHDNRSGWVTDFVRNLQEELATTIKEPVSIYFDTNPHDGLLETHNVDKSLEVKLKCLLFIPIISQTYCDPKSFAWQHEFRAFNKLSKESAVGRDVKLTNGNVASRILPVRIHDLDRADHLVLESEMTGMLRSIDFIYKEPGVNRPLKQDDREQKNLNKTKYRNQINKAANAIKEIITGIKEGTVKPHQSSGLPLQRRSAPFKRPSKTLKYGVPLAVVALFVILLGYFYIDMDNAKASSSEMHSIAVLPFQDMSASHDQEYLGDGIAEEILNVLSHIKGLKVIGRTSSFSFRGKETDLHTMGKMLNVETILEGSVRKSGNQIRITAQLINTEDGSHIWSETFNSELKDILAIQDEMAAKISKKLQLTFLENRRTNEERVANPEAYEFVLKGNLNFNKGPEGYEHALEDYAKAIAIDSLYATPYLQRGWTILNQTSIYVYSPIEGYAKARVELEKGIQLAATNAENHLAYAYLAVLHLWEYDWPKALGEYEKSLVFNPKPDQFYAFYQAFVHGNTAEATSTMEKLVEEDPVNVGLLKNLALHQHWNREYDMASKTCDKIIDINPSYVEAYRLKAIIQDAAGEYDEALESCQKAGQLANTTEFVEKMIIAAHDGKTAEVKKQMLDIENGANTAKMSPGQKALVYFSLRENDLGFKWLNRAYDDREFSLTAIKIAPELDDVRSDVRFGLLIKKMHFPE